METIKTFEDGPGTILSMVSEGLAQAIQRVPADLIDMDEKELAQLTPYKKFTPVDVKLRISFWKEYQRAMNKNKKILNSKIFTGICTGRYFYDFFLQNKARVAYMLKPLPSDERMFEELGFLAVEKLRELLTMDFYDDDGKPNSKTAAVVYKAVELSLNRAHGALLQVIHQKNINLNMNKEITNNSEDGHAQELTLDQIDKEIAELEYKKNNLVIEVPHVVELQKVLTDAG